MSNSDAMDEDDFEGSDLDERNVDQGELDERDGDKVEDLDDDDDEEEQDENIEEQGENLDEQDEGDNLEEQEEGNLDELEEEGDLEEIDENIEEQDEDLEDQDENSDEKDIGEANFDEKVEEENLDEQEEEDHLEDLEELDENLDEQDEDLEDQDENSDEKDIEEENLGEKGPGEANLDEKDVEEENDDDDEEMGEEEDLEESGSLVSATSGEIREVNASHDAGNSQSSINSDEIETDKVDNSGNDCDKTLNSKSKSTNSEKNDLTIKSKNFEGESLVIDGDQSMKENNDSQDSKSEESRSSLNSEKSLKAPNLLGGKPAAMWKLVNGTKNEGSNKEDDESDGGLTPEKKKAKLEETESKKNKTEEIIIREKENGKESPEKSEGDKIQSDKDDDKKSTESTSVADERIDKTGENEIGALVETRRRSLRTAAKRIEIEAKTPPKVEKRKSTDSPKSKDKKQIKVETKEPPKPVEPTTEPMSEEILEEAKFPKFLKDTITLGCYVPIRDKNASNIKLKEGESLLETPSITMPLLLKKPDLINKSVEITKPPPAKEDPTKKNFYQVKPFFNSSVGEFLIGIGLSRVNEWYEKDMMKLKQRQLKRDVNNLELDTSLQDHTTNYARSKQANEPFNFEMKKCKMCDFRTESELVLQGHLLVPHMTPRREFRCNFCNFITRDHKVILFHMEALHGKKGVLELPGQFFYDCPYCPFETNLKTRATSHINKCMKYFLSARNQLPPGDWENPTITAKPITLSDIKSYEMCVAAATAVARTNAQKNTQQRIITTTKMLQQPQRIIRPAPSQRITTTSNLSLYQQIVSASLKDSGHFGNNVQKNRYQSPTMKTLPGKPEITVAVPGGQLYQVVNNGQVVPLIGHGGNSQFLLPQQTSNSNAPQPVALFPNLAASGQKNSISIIPQSSQNTMKRSSSFPIASPAVLSKMQNLPKLQGPYTTVQTASKSTYGNPMLPNTTFVICEICDGYLKDLEQLRTHMLWIHKVKIHPKMLSSRPPLNCQKCQWRFFTDQGLERHLLGAHGLVTSNMQELANKNQDGGRCTVCGRVYVCKLVSHMNQVHKATLKPAHLSYKCTVCSATFNLYKLFENHVYMFHSGSVKRSSDDANIAKKKLAASPSVEMTVVSVKKPIDNSMKVTVIPAPAVRATLPPPMKLPAVEPIPSVTITPTNVVTAPATENPSDRLKKNSVDAENVEKTVINIIKKPQPHFNDIVRCKECGKLVRNISVHMKLRHTKRCRIKVCHILKCEKCLGSFDGMVVLHTADFEENSDSEGAAEEVLPAVETV